jgi:hypothetical protein
VINEMLQSNYLHEGQNKRKIVSSKKELLARWAQAYRQQLKPKILIGNYTSKSIDLLRTFKKIDIKELNSEWGGEAAANFWDKNHPIFASTKKLPAAVSPILVYAELITSNDSRNIDTAQRIFDEYIQFTN